MGAKLGVTVSDIKEHFFVQLFFVVANKISRYLLPYQSLVSEGLYLRRVYLYRTAGSGTSAKALRKGSSTATLRSCKQNPGDSEYLVITGLVWMD